MSTMDSWRRVLACKHKNNILGGGRQVTLKTVPYVLVWCQLTSTQRPSSKRPGYIAHISCFGADRQIWIFGVARQSRVLARNPRMFFQGQHQFTTLFLFSTTKLSRPHGVVHTLCFTVMLRQNPSERCFDANVRWRTPPIGMQVIVNLRVRGGREVPYNICTSCTTIPLSHLRPE